MFDTHCHLTDLDAPYEEASAAIDRGVTLLSCGYHAESCREVAALRYAAPRVGVAFGLHPWFAEEPLDPILEHIEQPGASAVGEIGLDLYRSANVPTLDRQRAVLEAQLEFANRLGLPVSLHSRHAVEPLLEVLKRHPGVRGVFHAFTGSAEQARVALRLGFLLGVGGGATRPGAKRVRRLIEQLPLESFVLETDCPAIPMDGISREQVRPWHVARVAATIAALKGVPLEAVEEVTDTNAAALFPLAA